LRSAARGPERPSIRVRRSTGWLSSASRLGRSRSTGVSAPTCSC
jgi:hypothetical protein